VGNDLFDDVPTSEVAQPSAWSGRIGVCLSGGGYRAAAFHLGVLAYLNRQRLLERVDVLSMVSGGSIVGAAWLLWASGNPGPDDFGKFKKAFERRLVETDCIGEALEKLVTAGRDRRSLACALADVYAERFFARKGVATRFSEIADAKGLPGEVVFNATEFDEARGYRFVASDTGGVNGNITRRLRGQDVAQCRVADIVAASSCFPAAFEPLIYPDDFDGIGAKPPNNADGVPTPVPLMDGGLFDNQGIDALLLAQQRLGEKRVDVVLISDTDRPPKTLYQPSRWTAWFARAPGLLALAILAILLLWPVVFLVGACVAIVMAIDRVPSRRLLPLLNALFWLSPGQFANMLWARIKSVLALTISVFMARIRALGYDRLFPNATLEAQLAGARSVRRISNLIYSLRKRKPGDPHLLIGSTTRRDAHLKNLGFAPPTEALAATIDAAYEAGTTLWFDTRAECDALVTAGMATTCFNLAKHFAEVRPWPQAKADPVFKLLLEDWAVFRKGKQVDPHPPQSR
jgi:predicted acylesterase/phospholipase RssA